MMSFKEFKATVCTAKVAGPQKDITSNTITKATNKSKNSNSAKDQKALLPSTSSSAASLSPSSSTFSTRKMEEDLDIKFDKLFSFIAETCREIRRFYSSAYDNSYSTQIIQTIIKYKSGINDIFGKVVDSYDMSRKLSQNIVRTIDLFKELCNCWTDTEEYQHRMCEIISIFIACELRLSMDAPPQERLSIAHRIIYIMRRHLTQEEEEQTRYNIIRTLVFIPKLYDAREIMCAIFGEFIPIKPMVKVNVLPDKLYMLYIIVFYRWMMMQKDDDDKLLIVNFAESFMKPSISLCSNNLYSPYMPIYTTHSTATRTILNNLKYYRDLRNASIIDNAVQKIGSIVNLCDDDEDEDVILVDSSPTSDFLQVFVSVTLEPLSGCFSNIKLEKETVVDTVDLTEDEIPINTRCSIIERHEKWLNNFQKFTKEYRDAQLLLEKHRMSTNDNAVTISLDSDSEGEEEAISADINKETSTTATIKAATQPNNFEDLFVDSYPPTTTPINCEDDFESFEADNGDDVTKISSIFLSGALRTYQAKKSCNSNVAQTKDGINFNPEISAAENNSRQSDMNKAYRRDSIHITCTPPERAENEDDEGTDVQDEHDDQPDEEEETTAYTFLPTVSKKTVKETLNKEIRPMGPYPTYNNMFGNNSKNDKVVFSQSLLRYPRQQQQTHHQNQQDKTCLNSSEAKTPQKQKKTVHFNTSPLGPTASNTSQKVTLKPALQQQKYKASDAPEYFHLRGFDRFPCAASLAGSTSTSASNSTSSSLKQQEHLAQAATLFRNILDGPCLSHSYPAPFSPSSSSVSSRSLSSPGTALTPKISRLAKNKKASLKERRPSMGNRRDLNLHSEPVRNKERCFSIIKYREALNDGYNSTGPPGFPSYVESSDDYYAVASDSDIFLNERYKNDVKLHKRCAVVITPTKELIQYERKRVQMYNEILQKQRRKLELRALEKQREKERRRLGRREEKKDSTEKIKDKSIRRKARNYNEIFLSSESEIETNFHVRTRRQSQQCFKEAQPLNIQIETTEATTNSLLNEIDAHLDKPESEGPNDGKTLKSNIEVWQNGVDDINQKTCDISDKGQTKMRELNLLADIAQHLSPYQLDLPDNSISDNHRNESPPITPTTALASETTQHHSQQAKAPREKVTVTEHLIIQSFDNLLEKTQTQLVINDHQQQQATTPIYAHEPKLITAEILNSSPSASLLQIQIPNQNSASLKYNDNFKESTNTESMHSVDTLEEILEESISVIKNPPSPFNPVRESAISNQFGESAIPILISNVESLNHLEQTDERQKSNDNVDHLITEEVENKNSENLVLQNTTVNTKDVIDDPVKNVSTMETETETETELLSSAILNPIESEMVAGSDLPSISSETEISQALKVTNLMSADLSDISLESEISKHLPEIAEPSPVVTDMSDNSNESQISQASFHFHNSNRAVRVAEVSDGILSLPVLPLDMPNIPQQPHGNQESIESNFNNLNSTLNTPIKQTEMQPREVKNSSSNQSSNDLNTPLKFSLQTQLECEKEHEADNNVTKFLDLILNKTVTDAESETRDKIIKELNALTADTTGGSLETSEIDKSHEEPIVKETVLSDNKTNESLQNMKDVLEKETQSVEDRKEVSESLKTLDNSIYETKENKEFESSAKIDNSAEQRDVTQPNDSTKETKELSPPTNLVQEEKTSTHMLNDDVTTSEPNKRKSSPIKQTVNIKCRVRLKRVSVEKHCKTHQKETWMAIPITKNEEIVNNLAIVATANNNSDITNCDKMTDSTKSLIIKPCLKYNNSSNKKRSGNEMELKTAEELTSEDPKNFTTETKRAKLEVEPPTVTETSPANRKTSQKESDAVPFIPLTSTTPTKSKSKPLKTVTFDLSNLNEELRDSTSLNHRSKSKNHAASIAAGAMGFYLKNSRPPRKLPDNTLRAAETLQLFVNTINDSTRTPPPAEFNKKRSPIKNKCIAEDETPRPPPASTLMGTPPCKKSYTEKVRSQITSSKCKDQLESSLTTASISSIASDITTARIYTSSPLDQTLPEYDDNVDTVADSELILPTTTGSLRRKLKRPKKSLTRPEPVDDVSIEDISNHPECNGEDDTDAVVDNEDDVFAEELLPIPAANEHILEEIVSARPSHIGTATVIRDDYMNIEATATVPVYLFNDESRDLATPEPIQSSDTTNVVDSSSYLNNSSSATTVMQANTASTTTSSSASAVGGNLEKSMLSPSEHEVSSTQETFYQTPTKSKQFGQTNSEKSAINKDKSIGGGVGNTSSNSGQKQKNEDNVFQNKEDDQTSSSTGLLQNNQVDTTNHSPEMCTLTLTPPATTTKNLSMTSNRKNRKASTHDEILFNELQLQQQQQQPTTKRKILTTTTSTFCAESTSDNNANSKLLTSNIEETKSNGSLVKNDKSKKMVKETFKLNKSVNSNELEVEAMAAVASGGGGGSSPSTTTIINEDKLSRSKRKKQKSSKPPKIKNHKERSTKIVLKASKLAAHIPAVNATTAPSANPLIITIPKSKLLRPPTTPIPQTPAEYQSEIGQQKEFLDAPNAKLFLGKDREKAAETVQMSSKHHHHHHHQNHGTSSATKKEFHKASAIVNDKFKSSDGLPSTNSKIPNLEKCSIVDFESHDILRNINSTKVTEITSKAATLSESTARNKIKAANNCKTSSTTGNINPPTTSLSHTYNKNSSANNHLIFVRDKYDLIKSKDKSQYHQRYDTQDSKDKLKDKTSNSQSKSTISPSSTRLHKSSSKEKLKVKHKSTDKSTPQAENILKFNISKTSNKSVTSISTSTLSLLASNIKQNSSKVHKNSSHSSSMSSSLSASSAAATDILKSKINLSPQSVTAAAYNASTHNNTMPSSTPTLSSPPVAISTNHVRKKLKTK